MFLDGKERSVRRGREAKEQVAIALGIRPDGRREIPGRCLERKGRARPSERSSHMRTGRFARFMPCGPEQE